MPRHRPDARLASKTARERLTARPKPYFTTIAPRISLGYRKNKHGPGVWIARGVIGKGSQWTEKFAVADDHEDADGEKVLRFSDAQHKAREIARARSGGGMVTVAQAIDNYARSLTANNRNVANATRLKPLLPEAILRRPLVKLQPHELRSLRDSLVADRGNKASAANRSFKALRAALNLAVRDNPNLPDAAWRRIEALDEDPPTPKIIEDPAQLRAIVRGARRLDPGFGILIEVLAVTGARRSQVERLEVADLIDAQSRAPQLSMPPDRKGRGRRPRTYVRLPIGRGLARRLARAVAGRAPTAPLILAAGMDLKKFAQTFAEVVTPLGLAEVTPGWLRHTHIVNQLCNKDVEKRVDLRLCARAHSTSVQEIERTYARYIDRARDSEAVLRRALAEFD
jgi:integrase